MKLATDCRSKEHPRLPSLNQSRPKHSQVVRRGRSHKRRVDGLYAGDASIMPDIPSVAINPTVILTAESAADRIKAASS